MTDYEYHELSNFFPMLPEKEFEALKESIADIGLREPIVLYDGQILDGRNRYEAIQELREEGEDIEARFVSLDNDTSPMDYVVSANLRRRNLTKSQSIAILRRIFPPKSPGNQPKDTDSVALSQTEMAKKAGAGKGTVAEVDRVIEEGRSVGYDSIQDDIAEGRTSVHAAQKEVRRKKEQGTWKSGRDAAELIDIAQGAERWVGRFERRLTTTASPLHHDAAQYLNNRFGKIQDQIDQIRGRLKEMEDGST